MNGQNMTYLIFVTCTLRSVFVLGVATEFDTSALLVDHYPQVFFTWAELELFNHYLYFFISMLPMIHTVLNSRPTNSRFISTALLCLSYTLLPLTVCTFKA